MKTKKQTVSVNMTDVALRAGVSQATVSRVVNRYPSISGKTRQAVLKAINDLGYKSAFHNLFEDEERNNFVIDFVMCPLPEQKNPFLLDFFSMMLEGAKRGTEGTDFRVRVVMLPADATEPSSELSGEGEILVAYPSPELRRKLKAAKIPYVVASADCDAGEDEDLVGVDNFEASVRAGEYLIESGCRNIGFMLCKQNIIRFSGFLHAITAHGLTVRPDDFRLQKDSNIGTFIECAHRWIAERNLPDAIVVGFEAAAEAVKTIFQLNGIRVPEDIRLLSFGHCAPTVCPCLCVDPARLGHHAALRLLEKLRRPAELPYWTILPLVLEKEMAEAVGRGSRE